MSKQLQSLKEKYPDIIQDISIETDTNDGYWILLLHGWFCPEMGCGTIHEYTVKACIEMFKTVERIEE